MRSLFIFVVFIAFSQVPGLSQDSGDDVWTLERCIRYAYDNNLEIKRSELATSVVQKDYNQSKYSLMPSLYGRVEHQLSSGRSLNLEEYKWENKSIQQGSMGIQADLTLFNGLQNYNNIQYNKYLLLSKLEDQESLKNNITLNLVAYYLQVLLDKELVAVAQQQYDITMMQVEKNRKLVEVGNIARGDLLEIQAQAASDKLKLVQSETKYHGSILALTQLLDLDSVGNFTIYEPDMELQSVEIPPEVTDVYHAAVNIMPEIKSGEYRMKAQEKKLAYNRGARVPELYLSGLYYSRYLMNARNPLDSNTENPSLSYPLTDQIVDNRYAQMSIGLSIPIFTKLNTQTVISKSKIQLEDYKLALEQDKQVLYKNIQQAHSDAAAALERYNSAKEAVKFNEESFNYTTEKFAVGLVNSVDFNVAKNDLAKAQSDYAQAKYEYIFRMKILDFYQGNPIHL